MSSSTENKKFWRIQIKHRAILALGGKCTVCNNTFEDCCYDFHHIDPKLKSMSISNINTNGAKTWLKIRDELKKCVVVCSNCHRLIHAGYVVVENKNYFNDEYYDWDLVDYNQINHSTLEPIDSEKICPICGKPKSIKAKICQDCFKQQHIKFEISREELKEMIRTTPFTTIGKNFGVTDNAIRKRCKSFNLPYNKKEIKNYTDEEWQKI